MNTNELKCYLEESQITGPYFLNVYALDQLPQKNITKDPWLLVCNCCPAHLPGRHWIAMFKQSSTIEFFDSFGFHPNLYGLQSFLDAQDTNTILYNNVKLQSILTDVCGHYCLYFAYFRSLGESMHSIVERLHRLEEDQDEHVYDHVVKLYIE